ncbi:hypothetical protein [Solimicrobium silvestre]|uniref:Mobilization protein n=1 Tax=Solimicrobium silvestre TaxID=2099400 RepID=A0A2S9GYF5_9BURK|nr:hypothetical protein [Solimicrobium silvestre]PRC92738.1 hypothetical protein S2091_2468 [Solimicrobium silvestre]
MKSTLDKLQEKRSKLESQILAAKEAERRKAKAINFLSLLIDRFPESVQKNEKLFHEKLEHLMTDLASDVQRGGQ